MRQNYTLEILFSYFLLCNLIIVKTIEYSDYTVVSIFSNGTKKIHENSCLFDNGTLKKNCFSDEKWAFLLKKNDEFRIPLKTKGHLSTKTLKTGILMKKYKVYRHSRWKRQVRDVDECDSIEPPKPGKVTCRLFNGRGRDCVGKCAKGYRFVDGSMIKVHRCFNGGPWEPESTFPECLAQCRPSCQNGGVCIEVNTCSCPNEYRGEFCQYPITMCSVDKISNSASSWQCTHTKRESVCKISCYPPGSTGAATRYNIHSCSIEGRWHPPLPSCVTPRIVSCSDPGEIFNGLRNVSAQTGTNIHLIGSKILYRCNRDFDLTGSNIIECLSNGQWSSTKPTCTRKQQFEPREEVTEDFPINDNPRRGVTESFPINDSSRKNVSEDVTTEVRCPEIISPKNTEIKTIYTESAGTTLIFNVNNSDSGDILGKKFPVGTKVQYKCSSQFYKLYGSEYQTCQNGTWSGNKPVCLPNCGKSESPRQPLIVGGHVSEAGMWPWQVALTITSTTRRSGSSTRISRESMVCSGSLINEKWILTAAHCVAAQNSKSPLPSSSIVAYFGKHSRDSSLDDEHVQIRKVRRIIIHEDYDFVKFEADISLLELEIPVELTTRVQPVCLPTESTARDNLRAGQLGIVTGWGLTENGTFSTELREITLSVVSREECEESYHKGLRSITVSERMICAGGGPADTCSGDSGGPFVFLDPDSSRKWVLEGIISWGSGAGCGRAKEYSGFTKVIRFVEWIKTYL